MKELGENTEALHRGVGAEAVSQGVDALIAVGELGRFIAAGAAQAGMPPEAIRVVDTPYYEEAAAMLAEETKDGDCILFKASRAMALEKMAEALASKLKK
jgi:UDP-N-acetylmuramyl pentapeptide synthase